MNSNHFYFIELINKFENSYYKQPDDLYEKLKKKYNALELKYENSKYLNKQLKIKLKEFNNNYENDNILVENHNYSSCNCLMLN
jgi:hypothetical protein